MQKVKSSMISAIGYDEKMKNLMINFNNGRQYRYFKVEAEVYKDFIEASSKGRYFLDVIEGGYEVERVK